MVKYGDDSVRGNEQEQSLPPRNQVYNVKTTAKKQKPRRGVNRHRRESAFMGEVVNLVMTVAVSFIIFFLLQTYILKFFTVSGDSMYPSLHDGDKMIMSRLNSIERFDIVVVESENGKQEYIKRIIGMPGDEITVFQGNLYINGSLVQQPFINNEEVNSTVPIEDFTLYQLTGQSTVPEGHYFVLGDNRAISKDSRTIGFIAQEDVKGEAVFTIWPLNRIGTPKDYSYLYSK